MRSFINWEILQQIENSPGDFIVQRKVSLLNSFLFGYEEVCLKLNDKELLEKKYEKVPSLEDYARVKFKADNIGSRCFDSVISYTCEGEHDYYRKYLCFLHEYETHFPTDEVLSWRIFGGILRNLQARKWNGHNEIVCEFR